MNIRTIALAAGLIAAMTPSAVQAETLDQVYQRLGMTRSPYIPSAQDKVDDQQMKAVGKKAFYHCKMISDMAPPSVQWKVQLHCLYAAQAESGK